MTKSEDSGSPGWSVPYFMQTTEDVAKAIAAVATAAAAPHSPRPSAVFSIKDDNSQFQKFQCQFTWVLKGSSPPAFEVKKAAYNPKVLTSLKRQWARFQLHAMGNIYVKDPSRLFESMVVLGLHPNNDIRVLEQQILGRSACGERGQHKQAVHGTKFNRCNGENYTLHDQLFPTPLLSVTIDIQRWLPVWNYGFYGLIVIG